LTLDQSPEQFIQSAVLRYFPGSHGYFRLFVSIRQISCKYKQKNGCDQKISSV
jgi:hypothetical protein